LHHEIIATPRSDAAHNGRLDGSASVPKATANDCGARRSFRNIDEVFSFRGTRRVAEDVRGNNENIFAIARESR
jgi:hypothetical protein